MGAKKAATGLSTAGLVLIAGCAGGGGGHGTPTGITVPPPVVAPKNANKLSLNFTIPHAAPAYMVVAPHQSAFGRNARRGTQSYRPSPKFVRRPKFLGDGVLGGYILLDIYQNGQLASYQALSVGFGSTYDLSCYFAPPSYFSLQCYNTANIYAPGGNDTFFAVAYDSQHRVISETPGLPGTNIYGTAPAPVTIPYSGTVNIQTYGIPASVYIDSATPCIAAFTNFHIADADGDFMTGPMAYPITLGTGSGFYLSYDSTNLGSSFTLYNAPIGVYDILPTSSGQTGTLTAQTSAATLPVSFPTIYSVDQTAMVASTGGLYALGLVYGSSSSFACGQVPLRSLYTGQTLTFTNPVGISQDGGNSMVVLDDAGSNPTVDVILSDGLFIGPSAVPVAQVTLSSTGGDDIAATANLQAYVLNADGTIHRVDYSAAALYPFLYNSATDTQIASGFNTPAGSSIGAFADIYDYVFASSYGSSWIYELDGAYPGSPFVETRNISGAFEGPDENFTASVITTAVTTDATYMYANFRAWDPGQSSSFRAGVIGCSINNSIPCAGDLFINSFGSNFGGVGTLALVPSVPAVLATNGNMIIGLYEQNSSSSFGFVPSFTPNPSRIVTSPDGSFAGVQLGANFVFSSAQTLTPPVGSQAGTVATIWNFPFF